MTLRSRVVAPLLAIIAALVLVQYAHVWTAIPDSLARTSDFAGTYAAATLWRDGQASHMYDSAAEQRVIAAAGAPANHLDIPFENPPAAAVVAAPFSLLGAATAYRAWSLLQLLLTVLSVVVVVRVAPWPRDTPAWVRVAVALAAVAGFGTAALWVEGQWDGISALGLALAYWAWKREKPIAAGLAVGLSMAVAKPHLALGVIAFMLGRRDWRAFAAAAAGGAATLVFTLLAAGPGALAAFVAVLATPRYSPLVQMQGATGLFASWLGGWSLSYAAALTVSAAAFATAALLGARSTVDRSRFEPSFAGAVVLSLFGAPHLLSHDLALLAPALVALCAWTAREEAARRERWPGWMTMAALLAWLLVSVASQHDIGNAASCCDALGRVTPWALLLAGVACALVTSRGSRGGRQQVLVQPSP